MASGLVTVRLSRVDAAPWGFRLQGGKDFGTPLLIQKVNGGSLAEKAGLQVGDALIKVNNTEVFNIRHKDAQDAIVRAGNSFEVTLQRGPGATWKPAVTPVGSVPSPGSAVSSPVTKTSLTASRPAGPGPIGAGHNINPRPFSGPQLNGVGDQGTVKSITSKQYNNPVGIYSEETIAETLSAQAEVLAGGVLGVNFKKNEKSYNAANSEVLKMVQEIDKEPKEPEPVRPSSASFFSTQSHAVGGRATSPRPLTPIAQQMPPPPHQGNYMSKSLLQPVADTPKCSECSKYIVGVFVRIKDKNLHVECFKCATCGTSLKNVGYYNINNKLYCDIHAKLVARQNPPAPNLDPITVPPGARPPAGAISAAISSSMATAGPLSPQPGTLAPMPFHTPTSTLGPKPFGAPAAPPAPFSTPAAPVSAPSTLFTTPQAPALSTFSKPMPGRIPTKPLGNRKGPGGKTGTIAGTTAPRRGRGIMNPNVGLGARIPLCGQCHNQIRGPFITALGKIWCPEHFVCVNNQCRRPLQDIGFVEEAAGLYCEYCFEQYLAPTCNKCSTKIKGDCLNAIGKHFHPECFTCAYCGKLFGNSPFFLEDALPYCENDWNELFTTKCFSCGFPIEAGDRWVEALNNNYHSQCFSCTMCKKNLEGQSFYAKGGRPFCKNHAR